MSVLITLTVLQEGAEKVYAQGRCVGHISLYGKMVNPAYSTTCKLFSAMMERSVVPSSMLPM